MKIATWNLKNFFDTGVYQDISGRIVIQEQTVIDRVTYFESIIRESNVDILFLQEVQAEKALCELAQKLGMKVFKAKKDHRGIANTVLYKESLGEMSTESLALPSVHMPTCTQGVQGEEISLRREIVKLVVSLEGITTTLYGVHLKSALPLFLENDDRLNTEAYALALSRSVLHKTGEMLVLRKEVDREREKGNEVIVLGDFNESTSSTLFAVVKDSLREKTMLFDVMRDVNSERQTHLYKGGKLTFDTLLVSKNLMRKVKDVSISNENLEDMGELPLDNQRVESDHAMVTVTFI